MILRAQAIYLGGRAHAENAIIGRFFTEERGVVVAYVAGGRGRHLRPLVIPGNILDVQFSAKSEHQLPFAKLELVKSRGPWLSEPLPAAAISWASALSAAVLPERSAYPALFSALNALLDAICNAGAARDWVRAMIAFEALLLRELGYGGVAPKDGDLPHLFDLFSAQGKLISRYLLADQRGDVMGTREMLDQRLRRMKT